MARAFLFDLEGTLYVGDAVVPGAPGVVAALRARGIPFRLCSNTTSRPRAALVARLAALGIPVAPHEIWTAPLAAAAIARDRGHRVVLPLLPEPAHVDLEGLAFQGTPGAVIVGDLGARWDYATLQRAFEALHAGAELIACSKDRFFRRDGGLALDAGPFVAALEYATRTEAIVAGKPSASFFRAAVAQLGLEGLDPRDVVMVGDDLWSDVQGAQGAGCTAWAVATGKFRREDVASSGIAPDRVLASVADVTAFL